MARVKYVVSPDAHPGNADEKTRGDLADLFQHLFPGGQTAAPHAGYAILAQTPKVALGIARLADSIIYETFLAERRDLRELAIQALNLHFQCNFSFQAHLGIAAAAGISAELQAAIPYWRHTNLFDDEQKLVIEYALACSQGPVSEELFARVVARYGERGAIEFTVGIGWWVFWAIILNATGPVFQSEAAQPLPKDFATELGAGDVGK